MKILLFLLALTLLSCGGNTTATREAYSDSIISHAQHLSIVRHEDYVEVSILDPWRTGQTLGKYALISKGQSGAEVPEGMTLLRVPLQRSVVYSSVHTTAINELGAFHSIIGVADGQYFTDHDPMKPRITSGEVADIGSSMSPSVEKIIDIEADALLLSPLENGNLGGAERAGVPLVFMADYLESTPLARAEWIKFIGYLYGKADTADSIFSIVCHKYDSLRSIAAAASSPRPKVLTERPYSGVWYVPGGKSYMASMITDAGGNHPWADNTSVGSLPLDIAAVIDRASDADRWFVNSMTDLTPQSFLDNMPHAEAFKAFPNNVYVCNTRTTSIYLDLAFHPEHLLADYISIFHPEVLPEHKLRYFKTLKEVKEEF